MDIFFLIIILFMMWYSNSEKKYSELVFPRLFILILIIKLILRALK